MVAQLKRWTLARVSASKSVQHRAPPPPQAKEHTPAPPNLLERHKRNTREGEQTAEREERKGASETDPSPRATEQQQPSARVL